MDAFVDINQIGVQDFDTPRTLERKEQYPHHLNSSYLGQNSSLYTPMAHRKTSSEIPAHTYYSVNHNQPGESKRGTQMKSITDKWLRSFSFSRNLTEDEQNSQILANISHAQQQQQQANLEQQNSIANNYQTFDGADKSVSPLGIPFVPFAHTKTSFHARARETNFNSNEQQQLLNHTGNFQNNILAGENPEKDGQLTMLNNDEGLRKYDEKIRDVSDTLAKLRAYRTQLTAIEQQQKFKQQTKRAKSSLSNFNTTQNNSSDVSRRLPPIKQVQPVMYFSPFEHPQGQQSQSTKKRRSKKPKQAGINALAKNILSGLPQEKLANLMAVNMYNKALLKKEENEDKITTVISEQNKLLAKMLDQYDKRVHDTRKQIKLNVARLQSDNVQELRFERDKRNFEKVYSEAQQKFNRECSSLERMPLNNLSDISNGGDKNTKQLRYIPSHYKKYKSILETKVQQPPMIF